MAGDGDSNNGIEHSVQAASGTESIGGGGSPAPYQPLVILVFAVAAGMLIDRYLRLSLFAIGIDALGGAKLLVTWWLAGAAGLVLWWLAWRRQFDCAAAWILLI